VKISDKDLLRIVPGTVVLTMWRREGSSERQINMAARTGEARRAPELGAQSFQKCFEKKQPNKLFYHA